MSSGSLVNYTELLLKILRQLEIANQLKVLELKATTMAGSADATDIDGILRGTIHDA